ncbi:MAG: DUF4160 domain-containing protein [Flavobacteriales bacterium]|jgi:hypothetical protein|nr:DUF4160 domain-containing protein [Flavobacteriales bacterium]
MTPKPVLEDGFSIYFFSNENNEPPHVHVAKGSGRAKWWLTPTPKEKFAYGFKAGERRRIKQLIAKHHAYLIKAWNAHFGTNW